MSKLETWLWDKVICLPMPDWLITIYSNRLVKFAMKRVKDGKSDV